MSKIKRILHGFGSIFSRLLNVILGGNADQTLSAASYLKRQKHRWRYRLINMLFFWQDDHCLLSWQKDVQYARELLEANKGGPEA